MSLQFINVPTANSQPPAGLIVTLHGWGANAEDVSSLLPYINLPNYQFVLPNAPFPYPYSPIGRAWYDLRVENMYQGLTESRQLLIELLQSLEASTGVPLSRTILSGFSQGGAMTLDVGSKLPLAGLVVMSGYLHPDAIAAASGEIPPTLITHGRNDEVVPLQAAWKARETLGSLGVAVEYHEFDTGHEIDPQTLNVLRNFASNTLAD
ncbi:MAG: alpha/beta hydrolase [Nostoc sp. ZfuVER08]|uniref:Alpha/beta hydrolase n=1 Tax=Nostoc punctiforme FACHB-252 TaxID=1357509 RepID=A0ABR8H384_NOSPU|nr:alpha/beta hydrolase [Nostoc punctiforme]MBD2609736.1 alpha/beta hydrolase [Nostoc punctiforme FACHB-252]MBL1200385.1 alpha/beta hydrolase [Nostoc sp. GBBB01]MDZ8012937.1 alpha/beta hydrolase [Nostoc sp. ZfuVER08]